MYSLKPLTRSVYSQIPPRMIMTLVASIRCGSAAVLGADSLEVQGDFKVSVNKITPQYGIGIYDLAFAGSGIGPLVDEFGRRLQEHARTCNEVTEAGLRDALENWLTQSYASDLVRHFPTDHDQKAISGIACLRVIPSSVVALFEFYATTVKVVDKYALAGWD